MNDRKELGSLLEDKFQRLGSQRKEVLDVPDDLGDSILEVLEEVEEEKDLPINHGDDAELSSWFIDFLNEPPTESPAQKK